MSDTSRHTFHTRVVHHIRPDARWQGATLPPIFQNAAFAHDTAESLSNTFAGKTGDLIYSRLSNPTNQALEKVLADLEGGAGAIVMASGMAAVATGQRQCFEQAGQPMIGDRAVVPAGLVPEGASNPGFADPGRADDQQVLLAVDPIPGGELLEQRAIEAAGRPKVDVLDDRLLAQGSKPQACDQAFVAPLHCLPIEQQGETLLEAQGGNVGLSSLVVERLGHAGQAEGLQAFLGRMGEHRISFQW